MISALFLSMGAAFLLPAEGCLTLISNNINLSEVSFCDPVSDPFLKITKIHENMAYDAIFQQMDSATGVVGQKRTYGHRLPAIPGTTKHPTEGVGCFVVR